VTDARRTLERPIFLTREGGVLKLSFAYNQHIVERVKLLPFATYDGETRSWSVAVTREAVDALRDWFITEGLTDVCVDELIGADETVKDAAAAVLRRGSLKRPFLVQMGARSDVLFNRLRALPSASSSPGACSTTRRICYAPRTSP
jgi:hypothetical protein